MTDAAASRKILLRLTRLRAELLQEYPFFGTLLMRMRFGLAKCRTAFTDMERIVFDPEFAQRLSDEELSFVLLHEVMHCVLGHCLRGENFDQDIFNIACDIVVNSNILSFMGIPRFEIDGEEAMYLAPDGKPGYLYTAEEVYEMIWKRIRTEGGNLPAQDGRLVDDHTIWSRIASGKLMEQIWKKEILEAGKNSMANALPKGVRDILENYRRDSMINWREILNNFIQIHFDSYDYSYIPPDRRFWDSDMILPMFSQAEMENPENLWFCVDTSASVSDEALSAVYHEVEMALVQLPGLAGMLSFFDTSVTKPEEFHTREEFRKIKSQGGGGTSFHAIFRYMKTHMIEKLPCAIIILTDGYADFPPLEDTLEVPVLWIIFDSKVQPPWGQTVHMDIEK